MRVALHYFVACALALVIIKTIISCRARCPPLFRAVRVALHYFELCALPLVIIKAIFSCRARCPWPVNHYGTCQTFPGSTDSEKLGTDVSFPNSINHCHQHNYAKKASIETTRELYVIVTSQMLAVSSCIDDVRIGQHFELLGAVTG